MNGLWDVDLRTLFIIVALAAVSVVSRSFFFIARNDWTLPPQIQRGLQYAPIAALAAVIAPEIVMNSGALVTTWRDARLFAVAAGVAFFIWRRGQGQVVLGTIVVGMAVYLPLHIGLGW